VNTDKSTGSTAKPDPDFPRIYAETQRFSLGRPRNFLPMGDGETVLFLCSDSPTDDVLRLWRWVLQTNEISLLVDPQELANRPTSESSEIEAERRERMRERAHGITSFSSDPASSEVVFSVNGRVFTVDYQSGFVRPIEAPGFAVDPRISHGQVAAVVERSLWLLGEGSKVLLGVQDEHESFGLPDYLAAEEFSRHRGFWWSPQGDQLLVQHVDNSIVETWWVSPAETPEVHPRQLKYPAAGKPNPRSQLWLVDLEGISHRVAWANDEYPYLTRVDWSKERGLMIAMLSRDQRDLTVQTVSTIDGQTETLMSEHDNHWVEVISGSPTWAPQAVGQLLHTVDDLVENTRRLAIDSKVISPSHFLVNSIVAVRETSAVVTGHLEPLTQLVVEIDWSGNLRLLSDESGWTGVTASDEVTVLTQSNLSASEQSTTALWGDGKKVVMNLTSPTDSKGSFGNSKSIEFLADSAYPTAIVWPRGFTKGSRRLPIVMAPYGGPHGRRVLNTSYRNYASDQWLADHGFAVLIVDGPGTPGQGPKVEKMVAGDLCLATVSGQIAGLHFAVEKYPDSLDSERVGIHGWSFGGYLAAAALLHHPETFKAAIAGAPVTDWALYDSAYSERYLGLPEDGESPNYQRTSLINSASLLSRPLLLIHGLADDNVVFAHTLRLSQALLEAGKEHRVLPLSGVTHMASAVAVAENLERLQADFFVTQLT
jgi:dipeptidyl-peptidase-4